MIINYGISRVFDKAYILERIKDAGMNLSEYTDKPPDAVFQDFLNQSHSLQANETTECRIDSIKGSLVVIGVSQGKTGKTFDQSIVSWNSLIPAKPAIIDLIINNGVLSQPRNQTRIKVIEGMIDSISIYLGI